MSPRGSFAFLRMTDEKNFRWLPRTLLLSWVLVCGQQLVAGHFVADHALDFPALIAPPPAADSLVTRAELDVVLQLQELRTAALAKRAQEIEGETLFGFAADVVGPWFKAVSLPKTAALFAAVREDFIAVNRASKALWPRKRPPFADARALETRRMKMFTGVHYPSDLEAGRIVGDALARAMLQSPALQQALAEAR